MADNVPLLETEQHISETQISAQSIGVRNLTRSIVPLGPIIDTSSINLARSNIILTSLCLPESNPLLPSDESIQSSDSRGNSCRYCRCYKPEEGVIQCPCYCTGSVGFVHLKCLKRWILCRGYTLCEICHHPFNLPQEKRSYDVMFRSFFRPIYFGALLKHTMNLTLVTPMAYFTLYNLVSAVDYFDSEEDVFKILLFGPTLIFATCFYLFLYFDWTITTILKIKFIFRHWWKFGDQIDDDAGSYLSLDESGFFDFDWMNF